MFTPSSAFFFVTFLPPPCDSPNTSRRFALGASNACLVGQKPDELRPGIIGMRRPMVMRQQPCMIPSTPPFPGCLPPDTTHKENGRITSCVHGQAPTRKAATVRIITSPLPSLGEATPENDQIRSTQSPNARDSASQVTFTRGCSSPFRRLAQHLAALRALSEQSNVCLVGENPICSVPALRGCEGLWLYIPGIQLRPCTT